MLNEQAAAKPCSRCHKAPRKPKQSYCIECLRTYQREWARRNRGCKPRPVKPVVVDGEKFCPRCTRTLPVERFSRCRGKYDGRCAHCKDCARFRKSMHRKPLTAAQRRQRNGYMRQWRADHPGYNARACAAQKRKRTWRRILGTLGRRA